MNVAACINKFYSVKKFIRQSACGITSMIMYTSYCFSQDIHFSQFFETPLLRNPALAGIFSGDLRIQGVYRTQWNSITVPYQTASLNGEYKQPIGHSDDYI